MNFTSLHFTCGNFCSFSLLSMHCFFKLNRALLLYLGVTENLQLINMHVNLQDFYINIELAKQAAKCLDLS